MALMAAKIRNEVLRKVFKEGVESVDESTLKKLFSSTRPLASAREDLSILGKKIFRAEANPNRLYTEGFRQGGQPFQPHVEDYLLQKGYTEDQIARFADEGLPKELATKLYSYFHKKGYLRKMGGLYDEPGLYWAPNKALTEEGLAHYRRDNPNKSMIEGIVNPNAVGEGIYNAGEEIVQQKANQVLAKMKINGKTVFKIISLPAAAATAVLANEDEAEASPGGKMITKGILGAATKSAIKGEESSASKRLVGTAFKDSIIEKVIKGKGDHRYIITSDGETSLVDKSFINSLSRKVGTETKLGEFQLAPKESKLTQAYRSLDIHLKKPEVSKKELLDFHSNYKNQLLTEGIEAPSTSLVNVEGRHLTFPTEYADILEKEGALKILKRL